MLHHTIHFKSEQAEWVSFVHGAGGSSAIWYKQIRDFKQDYNVLMIDLRGHGKSKNHSYEKFKKYTFDSISDEIIDVLNHNNIASSHFVGISLGTIIIREIAERFPERIKSMVLAGAIMKLNFRGQVLMHTGVVLKSILPYLILYRFFAFIIMPRKKHRESRFLFIKEAKKLYQKEFIRWFTLVSEVNPLLSFFRSKDCGIRTLYVMGEEDYMFLPPIKKITELHTSSSLFVIPNCGHVVNIERPSEFNNSVLSFLAFK